MVQQVSLWREDPGTGVLRVDGSRPHLSEQDRAAAVAYLRAGHVTLHTTTLIEDPLETDGRLRVPINQRTDGEWIWDDTLLYFVEKYSFTPPDEFMAYLRARKFKPRKLTARQLRSIKEMQDLP